EPLKRTPPDDSAVQAFFETHRDDYARPEAIRLAEIVIAAPANDAGARAARHKAAEALLAEARQKSASDFYAFERLAREKSDDAQTRPFGGELPPMTSEQLKVRF